MKNRISALPPWFWLAGAGLILFLLPAGAPLTDGDTAFYGVIAQNMLESGNWQTLHYIEEYGLVDKPPLTLWFMAASYALFGVNEFALRGWHALMSVGTVLLLYFTVHSFYGRRSATLAGGLLLTSALFAYSGFVPQQDIPLTFFSALAFYGLARFLRGDGVGFTYVFWIATAFGLLARGPQGVVFPMLVAAIVLYGTWRQGGSPKPTGPYGARIAGHVVAGAALFAVISVPWFVLEYREHGWPIIDLLLGAGQARFFESSDRGPDVFRFWAYFPLLIVACLPWAGFIGHSLVGAFRRRNKTTSERQRMGDRLFLAWFLVAFFLPFLTEWRVIRYLLPALPALAALVAVYVAPLFRVAGTEERNHSPRKDLAVSDLGVGDAEVDDEVTSVRRALRFAGWISLLVVVPVVLLLGAVYGQFFPEEQAHFGLLLTPFLVALVVAFGGYVVATWCQKDRLAIVTLLGGSFVAYGVLFASVAPHAELILPSYAAAKVINGEEPDIVLWVGSGHDPFLEFYVDRPLTRLEQLDDAVFALSVVNDRSDKGVVTPQERESTVVVVGDETSMGRLLSSREGLEEVIWRQDHMLVLRWQE